MNDLAWPGTDGHQQVSDPSPRSTQLRDAFCAFNKSHHWNRLAFGRKTLRMLCSQFTREFAPVASPTLIRQAVVMAGGRGTRLLPNSALQSKSLMPFRDMPVLELLLLRMRAVGVQEVILAVNHLRDLIEAYFGDGSKYGLRLHYCGGDKWSGAAGALGTMLDLLDETFFLATGRLLSTFDFGRMALAHVSERADASIGVYEQEKKNHFGLIEFDANKRLCLYREEEATSKSYADIGLYILQREAIRGHLTNVDYLDMPELLTKIQADNRNVICFDDPCVWLDIEQTDDECVLS